AKPTNDGFDDGFVARLTFGLALVEPPFVSAVIPTLSEWGLLAVVAVFVATGLVALRRRRSTSTWRSRRSSSRTRTCTTRPCRWRCRRAACSSPERSSRHARVLWRPSSRSARVTGMTDYTGGSGRPPIPPTLGAPGCSRGGATDLGPL